MKYTILLFMAIGLAACSKDDVYGPLNLQNGEEVNLLVSHRYGSTADTLFLLPQKEMVSISVHGFDERTAGYNYQIKAKMHIEKNPPADGSSYWFDFVKVIDKQKYAGNATFEIPLLVAYVPGGPVIVLHKINDQYFFVQDKIALSYVSEEVKNQLETIWQAALEQHSNTPTASLPWKSITATVVHDPDNFGNTYQVQHIAFVETN